MEVDAMKVQEKAVVEVIHNIAGPKPTSKIDECMRIIGTYRVEQWRDGKLVWWEDGKNLVTTVGKNYLLDTGFNSGSALANWYMGLVDNSGWSAFAAGDTMSSHAGWTESTAYSDSTRVAWGQGAAASGAITNSTQVTFNINATATIKGIFVVSNSTKGGTTGTLWNGVAFSSTASVVNGDQLKVTYTVTLS